LAILLYVSLVVLLLLFQEIAFAVLVRLAFLAATAAKTTASFFNE
jgi:hypothetical protein